MRAKALVPILAEIFGVPSETAFVIDRGLAEAGYRAKGKGRAWPEMTRREALYFLIACMTSTTAKGKVATRAAEDVALWAKAESEIRVTWEDHSEAEQAACLLPGRPEEEFEPKIVDRSLRLPFLAGMHEKKIMLIDYLLMLMSKPPHPYFFDEVTFTLSPSHLEATVAIRMGYYDDPDKETFYVFDSPAGYDAPADGGGIRTDISVPGEFLAAIVARTADPLAETAD